MWRGAALSLAIAAPLAAQEAVLPDCADAAGLQDCVILSGDLILAFLYSPVPDGAILTVTQSTAEGGARDISAEIPVKGVITAPSLYDIDGNGVGELFVPVSYNDPLTAFGLWSLVDTGFYALVDTVSADRPQAFTPLEFVILYLSPEVDGRIVESTHVFDETGLIRLFAVQMDRRTGHCTMVEGRSIWNEAIILADCEARLGEVELEDN